MNLQPSTHRSDPSAEHNDLNRETLQAIGSVRYGHVQIIIQDSRVVQK